MPEKGKGTRDIYCRKYKDCLDMAIKEGWDDFHCEGCEGEKIMKEKVRICKVCHESKPLNEENFKRHSRCEDGFVFTCLACMHKGGPQPRTSSISAPSEAKPDPLLENSIPAEELKPGTIAVETFEGDILKDFITILEHLGCNRDEIKEVVKARMLMPSREAMSQ